MHIIWAAIYLRISEDKLGDNLAIERQLAACQAIAKARGWKIVEIYSDPALSASNKKVRRPAYEKMLADYRAGRFQAVICWDLDRLTRQPAQLEEWISLAEEKGLLLVTANGEADLSVPNGRMFARIKATIGRGEVEQKVLRQLAKNEQNSQAGLPAPGGNRRFGFEPNHLTPREEEAVWVRKAYTDLLAGRTLYAIAKDFNAAGVPTINGNPWNQQKLRKVLLGERNAGILMRHGVEQPVSRIEPLVSRELFEQAKALLADPSRQAKPGRFTTVGLLNSIGRCGECGAPLRTGGNTQRGKSVRLYLCSARADGLASGRHPSIRAHIADELVMWEVFAWVTEHPELSEEPSSPRLGRLSTELERLKGQRVKVQELVLMPGADLTWTAAQLADLGQKIAAVEEELEAERARLSRSGILAAVREGWWERREVAEYTETEEAAVERWPAFWQGLELERRRDIVRTLLDVQLNAGRDAERLAMTHRAPASVVLVA